ncbi:MAG: hypothetical protein ACK5LC_10505 [Coprobacillaceae bacterium]
MEAIFGVLPVAVILILIWFVYSNISLAVTIFRAKKKDPSLASCQSRLGTYFYIGLVLVYVILLIISVIFMIILYLDKEQNIIYYILNSITIFSFACSYLFQQIIYVGHRQMLIGKILLDYRKIKRVTFPKDSQLQFVYGQKTYHTSLWFVDDFQLKKALQKAR